MIFELLVVVDQPSNKLSLSEFKIKDNLKLLTNVPNDKMFQIYQNVDLVFNPVLHSGITRVSIEAMSLAKPVIMYQSEGRSHLLDNSNSFIVKSDVDEIISLFERLERNKSEIFEKGEKAKELFKTSFSNSVNMPKIKKIYEECLT